MIHAGITAHNTELDSNYKTICDRLAEEIETGLPGSEIKLWYGHPVWFLNGNPIVGYAPRKGVIERYA